MSRPIISVENLSKAYRIGTKDEMPDTLVGAAKGVMRAPFKNLKRLRRLNTVKAESEESDDILWALGDVSFEINDGDVVGIIGRNGAGKSTLLKVLSRITEPTGGRAIIRGRVSSLLEVGTGFHPELTGRENVYMNGTILGMTKREIDRKFDEIVDFSGVEKFLDTPTKRYSSGMKVRLAFAVAAHLEPEILIVDEVLAVGDAAFQQKCVGRMRSVANEGRTVIFVSHNMAAVSNLCSRGIHLVDGRVNYDGEIRTCIEHYVACGSSLLSPSFEAASEGTPDSDIQLLHARIINRSGNARPSFSYGESFTIESGWRKLQPLPGLQISIRLYDSLGRFITAANTRHFTCEEFESVGDITLACRFDPNCLVPGTYSVMLSATILPHSRLVQHESCIRFEVQSSPIAGGAPFSLSAEAVFAIPAQWQASSISLPVTSKK